MTTKKFLSKQSVFYQSHKYLLKFFLIFTIAYLVGFSAILLANVSYADDVGRTGEGYSAWYGFSRYITEFLSHIIHTDGYLTNISPLPQILAIFISALSSTTLLYAFIPHKLSTLSWKKYIWLIIAVVPLVLCPYFLECFSYQYDSVYMAFSVFVAIFPILFRHRQKWLYGLIIFICTLLICTTYQASLGILPMIVTFFFFKDWFTGDYDFKPLIKEICVAAGATLLALMIFKLVLMTPVNLYVSNNLPPIAEFLPTFIKNLSTYFAMWFTDFKFFWLILIGIICLIFPFTALLKTTRHKITCLGLSLLCLCLMLLSIFGFYSLFTKPLFAPRASYGVGAFIALLGLFIIYYHDKIISKIAVTALSWCFFVFAFTYGNALKVQDQYIESKLNNVVADLNDLNLESNAKILQTEGDAGMSPIIQNMPQDYQILNHLLESSYAYDVIWNSYRLMYACDFCNFILDSSQDLTAANLPLLQSTAQYDIFGDDSQILIYFKQV